MHRVFGFSSCCICRYDINNQSPSFNLTLSVGFVFKVMHDFKSAVYYYIVNSVVRLRLKIKKKIRFISFISWSTYDSNISVNFDILKILTFILNVCHHSIKNVFWLISGFGSTQRIVLTISYLDYGKSTNLSSYGVDGSCMRKSEEYVVLMPVRQKISFMLKLSCLEYF